MVEILKSLSVFFPISLEIRETMRLLLRLSPNLFYQYFSDPLMIPPLTNICLRQGQGRSSAAKTTLERWKKLGVTDSPMCGWTEGHTESHRLTGRLTWWTSQSNGNCFPGQGSKQTQLLKCVTVIKWIHHLNLNRSGLSIQNHPSTFACLSREIYWYF